MSLKTQPLPAAETPSPPVLRTRLVSFLVRYGILLVLLALVVAAQATYGRFLTPTNVANLVTQNASTAIVAVGMTFVIIAGGFDISVTGILGLGSVFFAGLTISGFPVPAAFLIALALGVLCGVVNGVVVTRFRVNTFVATLGSASVFLGAAAFYSSSRPISVGAPASFGVIGSESFLGVPIVIWIIVGLYVAGGVVLSRTRFGRSIYAVGGNKEAARLAGLRVGGLQTSTFIISGLLAALAGCILASKISTGQYDQGATVALDSIAAVVIGGNSLYGGEGAMWRTAVGVLILATMNNLFSSLSVDPSIQNIIKGLVIIAAVAFEEFVRRTRTA